VAPSRGTHRIEVVYRVLGPARVRNWPERKIAFDLEGSAGYYYEEKRRKSRRESSDDSPG
jgi:hypothetical protein